MRTLVIGGSGFLGRSIVKYFLRQGQHVRSLDRVPSPEPLVESITGDVRNAEDVARACQQIDTVIHTASAISQQLGRVPVLYDVNVRGTENVIAACQRQGVSKLVYTSSIDVVFDGSPIRNGDESLPYPQTHLDYYGTTKMLAEKAVLAANGQAGLATCALRTAGIFGPYDAHRFPAVLQTVLDSNTLTQIGDGKAQFNHVFVENVAHAHWLAAQKLQLDSALAGQTYFVTDEPPRNFFHFFVPYLNELVPGYHTRKLPYALIWAFASALEMRFKLFPTEANSKVRLSRYVVASTGQDFSFNHHKASRDFGYQPIVDPDEAFRLTLSWAKAWLRERKTLTVG